MKYYYFVFYNFLAENNTMGCGNTVLEVDRRMNLSDDLIFIEKNIQEKDPNIKKCVVANMQLVKKEEEFRDGENPIISLL